MTCYIIFVNGTASFQNFMHDWRFCLHKSGRLTKLQDCKFREQIICIQFDSKSIRSMILHAIIQSFTYNADFSSASCVEHRIIPKRPDQIYIAAHHWKKEILSFPMMYHTSKAVPCIKF